MMRSRLVAPMLRYVEGAGGDWASIAARWGLPPDAKSNREVTLPLNAFIGLQAQAASMCGDPQFGLTLASLLDRGTWALVEYLATSAPDVRTCLQRYARYNELLNELVVARLLEREDEATIEHGVPGTPEGLGRHANECVLGWLLLQLRHLAQPDLVARRVRFSHAMPRDISPLVDWFGTEDIGFQAPMNHLVVDAAVLDQPMASADPSLSDVLEPTARDALAQRTHSDGRFAAEIRRRVAVRLAGGGPKLAEVAKSMGMSTRTLQRRLDERDLSFGAIRDDVRRELGIAGVAEGQETLAALATALGYADARSFAKAFRRWTGLSPRAYQRKHR